MGLEPPVRMELRDPLAKGDLTGLLQVWSDGDTRAFERVILDVLRSAVSSEPQLAPAALYLLRDLALDLSSQTLNPDVQATAKRVTALAAARVVDLEQASALQNALRTLIPTLASTAAAESVWTLFGPENNDGWSPRHPRRPRRTRSYWPSDWQPWTVLLRSLNAVPYATGEIGSGCQGVQDTATGHSLALAQMANLAIHELIETITDPRGTGWRDSYGTEIGNKCIMTFPANPVAYPVFSDGSVWKLQGVWSNAAFIAGTGAPNRAGQNACVW